MDGPFDGGQIAGFRGELDEMAEFAKLEMERAAEKIAVRHVERAVAESVIRAGEGDDTVLAGGEHRRFERGFDGFKTGIAENDFAVNWIRGPGSGVWGFGPAFEGNAAQFAREFGLARVRMHVAHRVQQTGHLFLPGFDDARIGVAGGGDAKRRGQIQILFPFGVPDVHVPGAFPDDRPRTVRFDEGNVARFKVAKPLQNGLGFRHKFTIFDLRFTHRHVGQS